MKFRVLIAQDGDIEIGGSPENLLKDKNHVTVIKCGGPKLVRYVQNALFEMTKGNVRGYDVIIICCPSSTKLKSFQAVRHIRKQGFVVIFHQ